MVAVAIEQRTVLGHAAGFFGAEIFVCLNERRITALYHRGLENVVVVLSSVEMLGKLGRAGLAVTAEAPSVLAFLGVEQERRYVIKYVECLSGVLEGVKGVFQAGRQIIQ